MNLKYQESSEDNAVDIKEGCGKELGKIIKQRKMLRGVY